MIYRYQISGTRKMEWLRCYKNPWYLFIIIFWAHIPVGTLQVCRIHFMFFSVVHIPSFCIDTQILVESRNPRSIRNIVTTLNHMFSLLPVKLGGNSFPRCLSVCPFVCPFVCLSVRQSTRCLSTQFSKILSVVLWDIELKFSIWTCLDIIQIKFDFCLV